MIADEVVWYERKFELFRQMNQSEQSMADLRRKILKVDKKKWRIGRQLADEKAQHQEIDTKFSQMQSSVSDYQKQIGVFTELTASDHRLADLQRGIHLLPTKALSLEAQLSEKMDLNGEMTARFARMEPSCISSKEQAQTAKKLLALLDNEPRGCE